MDYRQESIATLHDFGAADPPAPLEETAVVVPITERDFAGLAPERIFTSLSRLPVATVIIPLRAPETRIAEITEWLAGFDLPMDLLWCNAPQVDDLLESVSLGGHTGKGRDVWLGLGLASEYEYVAFHDADVRTHEPRDVRKLVAPLGVGYDYVKGYYARVEQSQLFGRLYRLFFAPLIDALAERETADIVRYLRAFRYALAGEMAMTGDLARKTRIPRRWGIEIGILGEMFRTAGFAGTSQVDLGRYEHDHRSVTGPTGLSDMSHGVARAVFRVLAEEGVEVDYDRLRTDYRERAAALVDQYAADAWFNGYDYDRGAERDQIELYADAIVEPDGDDRLPAWTDTDLDVAALHEARRAALDGID